MTEQEKRRSLARIAFEGLVRAPRRLKLLLVMNVVVIGGVAAVEIIDDIGADESTTVLRVAAPDADDGRGAVAEPGLGTVDDVSARPSVPLDRLHSSKGFACASAGSTRR